LLVIIVSAIRTKAQKLVGRTAQTCPALRLRGSRRVSLPQRNLRKINLLNGPKKKFHSKMLWWAMPTLRISP